MPDKSNSAPRQNTTVNLSAVPPSNATMTTTTTTTSWPAEQPVQTVVLPSITQTNTPAGNAGNGECSSDYDILFLSSLVHARRVSSGERRTIYNDIDNY